MMPAMARLLFIGLMLLVAFPAHGAYIVEPTMQPVVRPLMAVPAGAPAGAPTAGAGGAAGDSSAKRNDATREPGAGRRALAGPTRGRLMRNWPPKERLSAPDMLRFSRYQIGVGQPPAQS